MYALACAALPGAVTRPGLPEDPQAVIAKATLTATSAIAWLPGVLLIAGPCTPRNSLGIWPTSAVVRGDRNAVTSLPFQVSPAPRVSARPGRASRVHHRLPVAAADVHTC